MHAEPPINFFSWDDVPEDYATASKWPRRGRKVRDNQTPAARVVAKTTFKKGERFVPEARLLEDDGDSITVVADEIPLYHESQTRPYTARHRTLDFFNYEDIFFTGKLAPQGSLNAGIVLGARALWLEQVNEDAAAYILGQYVRDLPDSGVSGRLERGEYDEIDRVIRNTVRSVYRDNGGQADRDLSSARLARTAEGWRRAGFRFSDKSTWATANCVTETPHPVTFTEEIRQRIARPMSDALKVGDLALAVEVAEYVVGVVAARRQSGAGLSVAYFKKVIEQEFGIPCGAHGKVNKIVKAMCRLGLITKVASHQFSTTKGKGLAARYEVGPAVTGIGCE